MLGEQALIVARTGDPTTARPLAATRIEVDVLTSEGRIGAALAVVQQALATAPRAGSIETGDVALLARALELGHVLGREREVAHAIATRFILSSPARLAPGAFAASLAATACVALHVAEARPCFERLRALRRDGYFRRGASPDTEA